jgi:hypothetical protein
MPLDGSNGLRLIQPVPLDHRHQQNGDQCHSDYAERLGAQLVSDNIDRRGRGKPKFAL